MDPSPEEIKAQLHQAFPLSAQDVADETESSRSIIHKLAPDLEKEGHAIQIGGIWHFKKTAPVWVVSRPDLRRRGFRNDA